MYPSVVYWKAIYMQFLFSFFFFHFLACITGAYEPSEANAEFCAKRERTPPLVSRFAQNAAFASLGSKSAFYAGYSFSL